MMGFHLSSEIEHRKTIRCCLTSDRETLTDPVLCFSLQAPAKIVTGGEKIESLGGFTAARLIGTLAPGMPLNFDLAFEDPSFLISNRAWHPQGPYLRLPGKTSVVETDVFAGVRPSEEPASQIPPNGLALIPAPVAWHSHGGELEAGIFSVRGAFQGAADSMNAMLVRHGRSSLCEGGIPVTIREQSDMPDEGYCLSIAKGSVTLDASSESGAFYGLVSLVTLGHTHPAIPLGVIEDHPRFEWRGFMLDCVREYYPVGTIMKLLDLMAMLKLNRFHWHFADDESFRVQVDCAPDIWRHSTFRGEGEVIPAVFGGRPGPTGGNYSKADVSAVVKRAASLGIEVLPEIEVPAHALALTTIRPNLRDPLDVGAERSVQGYLRNVVNPALQDTWDLIEPLALEVAGLFPFDHIHLGGDELPMNTWEGSPLVDGYKAAHALRSRQDVQGHLMNRLSTAVRAAGYTPCAWQEAADGCNGGIGNDAILFSWTGLGLGRAAAQKGYRVVMCPAQHCYFDMAHSADTDDWGANWAATFALDKAFDWEPIPDHAVADRIIGVQGTFWSEFTYAPRQIEAMIAPRIFGLATKGWSPEHATDLHELRCASTCYLDIMNMIDWDMNWSAIWQDTPADYVRRADN